jgi:hypothetical protein
VSELSTENLRAHLSAHDDNYSRKVKGMILQQDRCIATKIASMDIGMNGALSELGLLNQDIQSPWNSVNS